MLWGFFNWNGAVCRLFFFFLDSLCRCSDFNSTPLTWTTKRTAFQGVLTLGLTASCRTREWRPPLPTSPLAWAHTAPSFHSRVCLCHHDATFFCVEEKLSHLAWWRQAVIFSKSSCRYKKTVYRRSWHCRNNSELYLQTTICASSIRWEPKYTPMNCKVHIISFKVRSC